LSKANTATEDNDSKSNGKTIRAELGDFTTRVQRVLPVVGNNDQLLGMFTAEELESLTANEKDGTGSIPLGQLAKADGMRAYRDETLRVLVYRMRSFGGPWTETFDADS
jgi:hypothetical protein